MTRTAHSILQIGQSNAIGQPGSPVLAGLPASYRSEQQKIKIWWEGDYLTRDNENGDFVNMHPVKNTCHSDYTNPKNAYYNTLGWSTEQVVSHSLLSAYDPIYVIKSAYGGKTISTWAAPSGERWVELERYITQALRYFELRDMTPVFVSATWLQGESDIAAGTTQDAYQTALETLISNIRGLSSTLTHLPFYLCEIPSGIWGDQTIVNDSFRNLSLADGDVHYVSTRRYADGYDNGASPAGHYTAQNLLDLGKDLYDKMTEAQN